MSPSTDSLVHRLVVDPLLCRFRFAWGVDRWAIVGRIRESREHLKNGIKAKTLLEECQQLKLHNWRFDWVSWTLARYDLEAYERARYLIACMEHEMANEGPDPHLDECLGILKKKTQEFETMYGFVLAELENRDLKEGLEDREATTEHDHLMGM